MAFLVSVDPGKDKCGLAAVSRDGTVVARMVVPSADIDSLMAGFLKEHSPERIVMGAGTFSKPIRRRIEPVAGGLPIEMIDESHSTEMARFLYFKEYPPRGLRRLIPIGLQVPPVPYDDFAAVVLARKYIESMGPGDEQKNR